MPTPDEEEISRLRSSILNGAPEPASDRADFTQMLAQNMAQLLTDEPLPRSSQLRVRLTGAGVVGQSVPVESAAQLLSAVQHSVSTVGAAIRRLNGVKGARGSDGIDPFELRIQPTVGAGSVVFFLDGPEQTVNLGALTSPEGEGVETILDSSVRELFKVINRAQMDDMDDVDPLRTEIQRLGVRAASALNKLAEHSLETDVELDMSLNSVSGGRVAGHLGPRGATTIRDVIATSSNRTEGTTLDGRLRTPSDGADKVRLELDSGKAVRLAVDPEVGVGLGPLLGSRVHAVVDVTVTWRLAQAQEVRTLKLISATKLSDPSTPN